jgi:hypothetical protein
MGRVEFSKLFFFAILFSVIVALLFGFGLYHGGKRTRVFWSVIELKNSLTEAVKTVIEEAPTITRIRPGHYLKGNRYQGNGVTINEIGEDDGGLILLAGFFEDNPEIRLIRHNGDIVVRWPLRFSEIIQNTDHLQNPPTTDWNVDIQGMMANPDGSIVFNFNSAGLVKLNRCGKVDWTLLRPTHHSVSAAEKGGYWVPSQRYHDTNSPVPFPLFENPLAETTMLRVSEDGKVLDEISVPELFFENGMEILLTLGRESYLPPRGTVTEIAHLNKITELSSEISQDFPQFGAGDLAVSLRDLSLIMIVDSNTKKIKWWRIGPWLRQHDPQFRAGGKLVVYNNNQYVNHNSNYLSTDGTVIPESGRSNIIEMDPATGQYEVIYGKGDDQIMSSPYRGSVDLTENGGLLVVEYPWGRVFQTDAKGKRVWEFVNRYDSESVAAISDAKYYPAGYFDVSDWSCAQPNE